jgi:hypothetical protein
MKELYDLRCKRDYPVDQLSGWFVLFQAMLFVFIGLL